MRKIYSNQKTNHFKDSQQFAEYFMLFLKSLPGSAFSEED